jgi:hypothetical protein
MQPFDGSGYGVSMYWRWKMKEIAEENKESCPCWIQKEPIITFKEDSGFDITISCQDKTCDKTFCKTEKELVDKFKIFYKV